MFAKDEIASLFSLEGRVAVITRQSLAVAGGFLIS